MTQDPDRIMVTGTMASKLEQTFAFQLAAVGLDRVDSEYRFHPTRRWRFDFAWPDQKVAVEIQGGIYRGKGGHTNVEGFIRDCDKYNEAQRLGWRVFKFTERHVRTGSAIKFIQGILDAEHN